MAVTGRAHRELQVRVLHVVHAAVHQRLVEVQYLQRHTFGKDHRRENRTEVATLTRQILGAFRDFAGSAIGLGLSTISSYLGSVFIK